MLSRPRKFALLLCVPYVLAALEYVFLPSYASWRSTFRGLPFFTVVEGATIAVPAAIVVGLVRRRSLFLLALLVLSGATSISVWVAPGIPDGEGGLALLMPFYVGVPVALGLGALDCLVGYLDGTM
jgi:hypothetical protein